MNENIPILQIYPQKARSLINRHPWVFSGAVAKLPPAAAGAIVKITDSSGKIYGYGHYAPNSQIICRIFCFTDQPLTIRPDFWHHKLSTAKKLREFLIRQQISLNPHTNGYRLIHAEGDGLPGLIADRYDQIVVLQYRTAGIQALAPLIEKWFLEQPEINYLFIHPFQTTETTETKEKGYWLHNQKPNNYNFKENNLIFTADIEQGQKTGFFLDQRNHRNAVAQYAKNRKVLNAFSYSGGFGIYALAGEAGYVVSVDASTRALAQVTHHTKLNFPDRISDHQPLHADCFEYLKTMPANEFDLIILDPPAFSKHISTVQQAARGYKELNLKAFRKIAAGGIVFTFSCSQHIDRNLFRKIIFAAAADANREIKILAQLSQPPDHPIDICHPEGEYLKGLILYVS